MDPEFLVNPGSTGRGTRAGPGPGRPVYIIHTSDRAVLMGEEDLTGPLRDLVITILAKGDPA